MDKNTNQFVVIFQTIVCVVLAVLLAGAYNALKDSIDANVTFDKQRNVLKATGLWDPSDAKSREELEKLFAERVRSEVLEVKREMVEEEVREAGQTVTKKVEKVVDVLKTDLAIEKLETLIREESKKPAEEQRELVPFYTRVDAAGNAEGYCIPISGYGLWSYLYGFLALKADLNRVQGITFYDHGETPGLGGEVENRAWQLTWPDKCVLDKDGELIGVRLQKGGASPDDPHAVDGLSGATITSDGVTRFVKRDLTTYLPYFKKLKS